MRNTKSKRKTPFAYIARLIFTLLGLMYTLIFSIKGICLLTYIFLNFNRIASTLQAGIFTKSPAGEININQAIIEVLKYSPSHWFDAILGVFNILILIHGSIGAYYIMSTSFKLRPMPKEKKLFYLQLLSSIAVLIFVIVQIRTTGATVVRMGAFWVMNILIAVLGGYHIGNGVFNACITLGITITQRKARIIKVVAWSIAAVSIVQITASLILN